MAGLGHDGAGSGGGYDHRQLCPLAAVALATGVVAGAAAVGLVLGAGVDVDLHSTVMLCATFIFGVLFGCTFIYMRVQDTGKSLVVSYGPMRLVVKEVFYKTVKSVGPATVRGLRGWQVMDGRPVRVYGARRGEAVRLELRRGPGVRLHRAVLIGTDDTAGLTAFLEDRITKGDAPS